MRVKSLKILVLLFVLYEVTHTVYAYKQFGNISVIVIYTLCLVTTLFKLLNRDKVRLRKHRLLLKLAVIVSMMLLVSILC